MRKKITVEHDSGWQASIEVDVDLVVPDIIGMVKFWSDSDYQLNFHDGDYLRVWADNLATYLYRGACEGRSEYYFIHHADEGWCTLSPENGFHNLQMDVVQFIGSDFDIQITEVVT